ncbi:thiol-disulfide isomerase/thioredoxin [Melaminivora alkalimesophila]|uniref:Thiol-disulfide isomerase/thioredoxin n=1 Tax=Melaminivora alkalimesophila TaxID=1165852 RepID=A0A317RFM1_9BURK|nr:thiol-disulfide isomerase/thioredoxin [Melaminivora alkalimesophila]
MLGAGALAGLAGAGVALRRLAPAPAAADAAARFWEASFDGLSDSPLSTAQFRGRPLLLNFWATWCPPCINELPLLDRFHEAHRGRGWQVLGLAIDQEASVRRFLERQPLGFPVALGGMAGSELGRALGNERGGLPFSVLFAADGSIIARKMGELTAQDLDGWLNRVGT